ncbi:MAG: hypothetical protein A2289_03445 [Deltaproteobacteria bacterium RIFOXYA12_FULL_58_15]|nr:MAG: hypothetical protein A2289_03445 [Deltaproteobacteria bacterium RIFOXYA12_FULL_58_15]OGR14241.1 MAG: hypothetical protein A2341_13540 [Deltaproteobacteria bacterium RIFOXYB12_FULL_58_9]
MKVVILLFAVTAYATAGFMFFEIDDRPELRWVDALWWALVTMTTVGFGDYFPTTIAGRALVGVPTMLVGMGMLGYALGQIAGFIVRAEKLNRKGMAVQKTSDHVIVCGYPGKPRFLRILEELRGKPTLRDSTIVLVDAELEELDHDLSEQNVRFVRGHPARGETLSRANVENAFRAVVLARDATDPDSDDLTVAICLILKKRRPDMHVVAELVESDNREVLAQTGCEHIVCVMDLAPGILAQELQDPGVVHVLQELTVWHEDLNNVFIVPLALENGPKTVDELLRWGRTHRATLLGVRSGDRVFLNPDPNQELRDGDGAIVICQTRPAHIEL